MLHIKQRNVCHAHVCHGNDKCFLPSKNPFARRSWIWDQQLHSTRLKFSAYATWLSMVKQEGSIHNDPMEDTFKRTTGFWKGALTPCSPTYMKPQLANKEDRPTIVMSHSVFLRSCYRLHQKHPEQSPSVPYPQWYQKKKQARVEIR